MAIDPTIDGAIFATLKSISANTQGEADLHCGADFPVANPSDFQPYTLDFVNDLPVGQYVQNAVVTMTLFDGTDPNPNSHVIGSPQVTPNGAGINTMVLQRVGGMLAGNIYSINMVATSNQGFTMELYALIPCEAVFS
jgi:hypothetical protein